MEQVWDCIVVGGGPAGLSAAVNLRRRGKSVLVLNGGASLLSRAELVDNYLGLPGLTGTEMMARFTRHALDEGVELRTARVGNVMPFGGTFMVNAGGEILTGKSVILACGVSKAKPVPGEAEYLGRGVSYCATCDGMLYRDKNVVVWGLSPDAPAEANFLAQIGCRVTYLAARQPEGLAAEIAFVPGAAKAIEGAAAVTAVRTLDGVLPADGVFVLRPSAPPDALVPGVETENGAVKVDGAMRTSIPGLLCAGDMAGAPYQVAKAVGDGLVAGLRAAEYIDALTKDGGSI